MAYGSPMYTEWPTHVPHEKYKTISIVRRFEDDSVLFHFESDDVVICVNPAKLRNPSRESIIIEMQTHRLAIDAFGKHWYDLYQKEHACLMLSRG